MQNISTFYLAVHFFINPLLAFMDGSYMLCHVALIRKRRITIFTLYFTPFLRTSCCSEDRECS